MSTWKHILDVPSEKPVQEGVDQHHEDGHVEAVALSVLRAPAHVAPLDPDALLLVLGEVLTAVPEGHAGQQTLGERNAWTPLLNVALNPID